MKFLLKAFLGLIVLAGAAVVAVVARERFEEAGEEDAAGRDAAAADGGAAAGPGPGAAETTPGVAMDEERRNRAGLTTEPLAAYRLRPGAKAYGRVLDPAPLVALEAELSAAEAASAAAGADAGRLRRLAEEGENASRRALEAAEAASATAESQVLGARRRLALAWGAAAAALAPAVRRAWVGRMSDFREVWLRADLPVGEAHGLEPVGAKIAAAGDEAAGLPAEVVAPAPDVDPGFQGRGWLLRVGGETAAPPGLRPGAAVMADLELPGEPRAGVLIPRDAVVRHDGKAWIYREAAPGRYERIEVPGDQPVAEGWFAADGFAAGDRAVVVGTQILLSEEFKSRIQREGGDEEDKGKKDGDKK